MNITKCSKCGRTGLAEDRLQAENERLRDSIKATDKRLSAEIARLQGKLDAVRSLSFDHNHNTRVFLSHCPRCQLDRILKRGE